MFFIASKILWILASPLNLAALGALMGPLLVKRLPRFGRALSLVCVGALVLIAVSPIGVLMIRPLEQRFPPPPAGAPAPYGIIVLGGAVDDAIGAARGQLTLRYGASRLTEAALLARRYPAARIVYTGGDGSLISPLNEEAEQAKAFFVGVGIDPARITLETRSRNTDENARFTAAIVNPKPDQVWWVVTSAYHMPRSMGLFVKAGFHARAFPVDYLSFGDERDLRINFVPIEGLRQFELAAHEWTGLIAYHATGKIDSWFPGP